MNMPSAAEPEAALAAMRARETRMGSTCGCFVAFARDPFAPGLVAHWNEAHADELPLLVASQVRRLEWESLRGSRLPSGT